MNTKITHLKDEAIQRVAGGDVVERLVVVDLNDGITPPDIEFGKLTLLNGTAGGNAPDVYTAASRLWAR